MNEVSAFGIVHKAKFMPKGMRKVVSRVVDDEKAGHSLTTAEKYVHGRGEGAAYGLVARRMIAQTKPRNGSTEEKVAGRMGALGGMLMGSMGQAGKQEARLVMKEREAAMARLKHRERRKLP